MNLFAVDTASVYAVEEQSDGKILIGGNFDFFGGYFSKNIVRLNSNGTIDNTFVVGSGFNGTVYTINQQTDGKILVGGFFTSYSGVSRNRIIRLNSGGTIDNTFITGTGFNASVNDLQIQSDGKILVVGDFTTYSGTSYNGIIRLNSDGSIDNTFIVGSGFDGRVNSVYIEDDGNILVCGEFKSYKGTTTGNLLRLSSNGSIAT